MRSTVRDGQPRGYQPSSIDVQTEPERASEATAAPGTAGKRMPGWIILIHNQEHESAVPIQTPVWMISNGTNAPARRWVFADSGARIARYQPARPYVDFAFNRRRNRVDTSKNKGLRRTVRPGQTTPPATAGMHIPPDRPAGKAEDPSYTRFTEAVRQAES